MMEMLNNEFDRIKDNTAEALKKAVGSFDYDRFIERSVHEWLEGQVNSSLETAMQNPLFDLEKELQPIIISKIKASINQLKVED
jgi:hypothetical protein